MPWCEEILCPCGDVLTPERPICPDCELSIRDEGFDECQEKLLPVLRELFFAANRTIGYVTGRRDHKELLEALDAARALLDLPLREW